MRRPRKTGKPIALEEAETDEVTEQEDTTLDNTNMEDFVSNLFGTSDYVHKPGVMPPIGWLQGKFKTKSAIIRFLHSEGHSVKDIHKGTGIRYQMVRNVLTNALKRGPNENFKLDDYESPSIKNPSK